MTYLQLTQPLTLMNPILPSLYAKLNELTATLLAFQFLDGQPESPISNQLRQHAYLKGQLDLTQELISALEAPVEVQAS